MDVSQASPSPQPPSKELPQNSDTAIPSESCQNTPDSANSKDGKFWSWTGFAQKAKAVLLEDGIPPQSQVPEQEQAASTIAPREVPESPPADQATQVQETGQSNAGKLMEGPILQKGLDAIASSLSLLGDTLGTAIEEGLNLVETKATEIMTPEPRNAALKRSTPLWKKSPSISPRFAMRMSAEKKEGIVTGKSEVTGLPGDIQLKTSRDVAMAMATKAKMLLRELKTVRGDLTFLRDRCSQLEEENRRLRESVVKGTRPDEDDLVRLQLETLLAEKQRLQQENANYARENQFLHEVVEYHQIEFNEDTLSGDCHELGLIQGDEEVDQMMSMNLSQEDMAAENSQMTR